MDESEFHRAADALIARVEAACAEADGLDADIESGILTVECPDGSRIVVNKQAPNREIWVAARSGGFHFRFDGAAWRDTRTGDELLGSLSRLVADQGGTRVEFG